MNKAVSTLVGLAAVAAAGVVTGILIAPHKGSKTRKIIRKKTQEISDDISKSVQDRMNTIERKLNHLRHKAEDEFETEVDEAKREAALKVEKTARKVEREAHKVAAN